MTKLEAKRFNEWLKLLANSFNNLGLLGSVSGAIVPYITGVAEPAWGWFMAWGVLHLMAFAALGLLQED